MVPPSGRLVNVPTIGVAAVLLITVKTVPGAQGNGWRSWGVKNARGLIVAPLLVTLEAIPLTEFSEPRIAPIRIEGECVSDCKDTGLRSVLPGMNLAAPDTLSPILTGPLMIPLPPSDPRFTCTVPVPVPLPVTLFTKSVPLTTNVPPW